VKSVSSTRRVVIILLHVVLFVVVAVVAYQHNDKMSVEKIPPASLSQWYKPENKRQVWLHNMFKLRREMQAVEFYAENSNGKLLNKWTSRLHEHYLNVGEMVPEWEGKLNNKAIDDLQHYAEQQQFQEIPGVLEVLMASCDSCHVDYQASTAALYRAPDFSYLKVGGSISLVTHMDNLTKQVNQVKIASEDGLTDLALSSLLDLESGLGLLGETCSSCHKDDVGAYPSESMLITMSKLKQSLKTGTLKDQGRELGTLAVTACATCHGTHRIAYNARKRLSERPDWTQLLKH